MSEPVEGCSAQNLPRLPAVSSCGRLDRRLQVAPSPPATSPVCHAPVHMTPETRVRDLLLLKCQSLLYDVMLSPGRFKEKNRTAQKRYRERQKSKLQDSEEKVAELTEQLNTLKVEKVHWDGVPTLAA